MLAVVKKRTCKYNSSLLVESPVVSLFVLQCLREDTGEIFYIFIVYHVVNLHFDSLVIGYMYAEDMAVGTVLFLPAARWWATLRMVHLCLKLPLLCQTLLMMSSMQKAMEVRVS